VPTRDDHVRAPKHSLDDRIDELCEKVALARPDDQELEAMSRELLCLWREKMNHIKKVAAARSAGAKVPKALSS
jgi:hypothetical protein